MKVKEFSEDFGTGSYSLVPTGAVGSIAGIIGITAALNSNDCEKKLDMLPLVTSTMTVRLSYLTLDCVGTVALNVS